MATTADPCVFCAIVVDPGLAVVVRQWPDAMAFLPRENSQGRRGCTEGHIVVIPKLHATDATTDPALTGLTAQRSAELAATLGIDFHLITTNCGEDARQTIPHLHFHVVPRRSGDGLLMPWTGQERGGPAVEEDPAVTDA